MHAQELATLRESLKRARKMLASSPRDLRAAREGEVLRLERAVKRAESVVHRDRREAVEAGALARARQDEREKRRQGKGAWYMKDGAHAFHLFSRRSLTGHFGSGQEGAAREGEVRGARRVRRPLCGAQGYREEAEKGRPEGEETQAVCAW